MRNTTAPWEYAGAAALCAGVGLFLMLIVHLYRWQDGQGVPRCLPWQTVDDGCDEYNVPCPEGFASKTGCVHGKLFPGDAL